MRIAIDPNQASRIWPGQLSAYRPSGAVLAVGDLVTVVQEEADEADYVGTARVIGIKGRFVGLDVDWASFTDEVGSESEEATDEWVRNSITWDLLTTREARVLPRATKRPWISTPRSRFVGATLARRGALGAAAAAGAIMFVPQAAVGGLVRPAPDPAIGFHDAASFNEHVFVS